MNYSNERKGFTIKDILIQVIVIVLFVFLLAWLFPTRANFNGLNKKLDILTGTMFGNNIQTMKEAAVSYYTNQRLPQAINDVERLTLKDMLSLHLLVDFVDGNGNSCSKTDSYVEVIKLKDEYQMKINLSCTDNDAYIIVHLGCYDYCNGLGICAKEEEIIVTPNKNITCSYEYEKIVGATLGDYGAWSDWSTNRVSESELRQVESKSEIALTGSRQVQVGSTLEEIAVIRTETKYCPEGYDLVNDKCVNNSSSSTKVDCPIGYDYNAATGKCTGPIIKYADPECPSRDYQRNGFSCSKVVTTSTSSCPEGYDLINGVCYGPATGVSYTKGAYIGTYTGASKPATNSTYYYETVSTDYVYDCNDECAFKWVVTYKKYHTVVTGGTRPTATPDVKTSSYTEYATARCTIGTPSGNKCIYQVNDTVDPTCPSKEYTLSGGRCYINSNKETQVLISSSVSCNDGYTLNGSVCTKLNPIYENQDVYENVTYYRYRTRSYTGGTRLTKWSNSQNDQTLLSQGYSLTGNKKCSE